MTTAQNSGNVQEQRGNGNVQEQDGNNHGSYDGMGCLTPAERVLEARWHMNNAMMAVDQPSVLDYFVGQDGNMIRRPDPQEVVNEARERFDRYWVMERALWTHERQYEREEARRRRVGEVHAINRIIEARRYEHEEARRRRVGEVHANNRIIEARRQTAHQKTQER